MKPISTQVEVFIPRPPHAVFEYFADLRHEPEYNARVHDVRKTTDGPLTCGTRFEGLHDGIGTVSWTLVEFDAPRHLAIEGHVGAGVYRWVSDFEVAVVGEGTTVHGRLEWQPGGALSLLGPLLQPLLGFEARRSFRRLAAALARTR
ncbi:MAG: SRPBCC family protein [Myxococcales bacterium]|nr:SRPBCC family protein [Myxococcales bacterium]